MTSASPSSSSGRSPAVMARSAGPPRRTYSRRRTMQAPSSVLDSDNDGTAEQAAQGQAERKPVGRMTRGRAITASISSPMVAVSSPRNLSQSRSSKSSPDVGRDSSRTHLSRPTLTTGLRMGSSAPGGSERSSACYPMPSDETPDKRGKRERVESSSPSPSPSPRKQRVTDSGLLRKTRPALTRSTSTAGTGNRVRDPSTPPRVAQIAPTTPTGSSPRDFAHLFAAVSPRHCAASSPGRNRLLERSHSSGKILDSPSKLRQRFGRIRDKDDVPLQPSTPKSSFGRTQSWPESPSKALVDESAEPDPSALWVKPVEVEVPGSGGRAKRTYGRTRTIVAEDADTVTDVDKLEAALAKESYADIRNRYEVNAGNAESTSTVVMDMPLARAPQSVNDMRSKGENRRFMDETGYLLDGIEDRNAPKASKRSICVDILEKMQDATWMSKMRICGQTERVWNAFQSLREDDDTVMDAVCLLALHFIIEQESGVKGLLRSHAPDCVRFVANLLTERNGALDEQGTTTPLIERTRKVGRQAGLTCDKRFMTSRALAAAILSRFCQSPLDEYVDASLVGERILSKVVKVFGLEVRSLSARFELHEGGLAIAPLDGSVEFDCACYCLSVIEHTVAISPMGRDALAQQDDFSQVLLQALVGLSGACLQAGSSQSTAWGVMSTLRIFANLNNVNSACAPRLLEVKGSLLALARVIVHRFAISRNIILDDADTSDAEANELLCLGLAILTSGILSESSLVEPIATLKMEPACTGLYACLRVCRCLHAEPFIKELSRLYTTFRDPETANTESSVIAAYLALLLSRIVTSAPESLEVIQIELPGESRADKLDDMLQSLRALDGYRSTLHRTSEQGQSSNEVGGNEVHDTIEALSRLVETC